MLVGNTSPSAGTAGQVLTSSGANAEPVWASASISQATPIASGTVYGLTNSSNTSLGQNGFGNNTTGVENAVLGYQAMNAALSVNYNTAIGYQALKTTQYSNNNTAVGYKTLYAQTSGNINIAIGGYAL